MTALHERLMPFERSAREPFDGVKAAHLLNRAGFGGTPEEVRRVRELGVAAAVGELLAFPDRSAAEQGAADVPNLSAVEKYPGTSRELTRMFLGKTTEQVGQLFVKVILANKAALVSVGDWWLKRMTGGTHPLQEKLTLFWHGHFTTSAGDERFARPMWEQNETFRRHAAGNFGALVKAVSRDPAMLDYLNNQQNKKGHPNENYARELMELFTLGVGNYTEGDVKEAARAFTGWGHNGREFIFRPFDHDYGAKTVLGRKGEFDGDDVVDVLLAQPACARFVASRLWNFFVSEAEPEGAVIESLAEVVRSNNYELRPALRVLFTSRAFYDAAVIGAQVKSPVQLLVGASRQIGVELPPARVLMQPSGALAQMGQLPFYPPNVKGWPGGRAWVNTSTLLVRYNACVRMAAEAKPGAAAAAAEAAVDEWVGRLIQRPIGEDQRRVLVEAVRAKPSADSVREMMQLIVSMPEYQLC